LNLILPFVSDLEFEKADKKSATFEMRKPKTENWKADF